MHENYYINKCISLIELKLSWGTSHQWTAYHFSKLSQEIFEQTGKTVSDSTLKRFFGKKDTKESYSPQVYTKDAIAEFLGFKDWDVFKNSINTNTKQEPAEKKANTNYGWIILLVAVLLIISLFFIFRPQQQKYQAWITCKDTSKTVPYTAVFQYDVSDMDDSVFIDFGNLTRIPLPKDKNTITEFYKTVGIYWVKIFTNKEVIDSIKLTNYSTNWQGGVSPNDDYRQYVQLDNQDSFQRNNRLHIPASQTQINFPGNRGGYYSEFRLVKDFPVNLDDIKFNTLVKNPENEGGLLCYDIEIWLLGSLNNCRVRFVHTDCYRYGQLQISEKIHNGRFDILAPFAKDLSDWRRIGIVILNKQVDISFEGKSIFKEPYTQSLGKLVGIYYRFYGSGSVSQVLVQNNAEQVLYKSDF